MADLSQSLVASLARALNAAEVPCVLWAIASSVFTACHPSSGQSIDLVIPDESLEIAAQALARCTGIGPGPSPHSCPATSPERHSQPPVFHTHLNSDLEVTAGLYIQSDTLWFLPPLDRSLLSPSSAQDLAPYFALASDTTVFPPWRPGRDSGVFKSAADPVVTPKSHVLLEAYMRIFARDQGKRVGSFGIAMIAYMQLYVDEDGFLDASLLPEPLRTSYRELNEGRKPVRQWMMELKGALGVGEDGG